MVADFFLRTYHLDYQWLPFLFRSLERHARQWRRLIVVIPFDDRDGFDAWKSALEVLDRYVPLSAWAERLRAAGTLSDRIVVESCQPYKDDYLGQCLTKLQAWKYSDADEVCFLDSDLVFTRGGDGSDGKCGGFFDSYSLQDVGPGGQWMPCVEIREWSEAGAALPAWFEVTKHLLDGVSPPYETMCRHPFQYPVQFLRRAWNFAEERLLKIDRHISEFNYLGNYARLHEPKNFVFQRPPHLHQEGLPTPDFHPDDWVRQFRSWDGLTPAVEAELRALGLWEDQ